MITARSSVFSSIRSLNLRRIAERSFASIARQAGWARLAASIARRVSAAPSAGTSPIASPVAGFFTTIVLPLSACTHLPSMQLDCRNSVGSRSGSGDVGFSMVRVPPYLVFPTR